MSSTETSEIKAPRELKDKKRRRAVKAEPRSCPESKKWRASSTVAAAGGDSSKPSARALFFEEENNVNDRDIAKDLEMHSNACREFKRILLKIKDLKASGKTEEVEELRISAALQFIILKKLNRLAHFRCQKVREQTNNAKQKIDEHQLQLQNLLYEMMHLQREITKCLQFKSKDKDINLVTQEEFYQEAPAEISKPELTKNDDHHCTLARLDWELEQRKSLSEKLKNAKDERDQIQKEIQSKKDYLDSLQPKLNSILQATKPVQEYLRMPFDAIREQHRIATYLPRPLYVLYMQATAYKDACDKHLAVTIEGDVDAAKTMEEASLDLDDDSDSDQEDQDKTAQKHRRKTKKDLMSEKRQRLLKKHPLSVLLKVGCKDGNTLSLTFIYLVALEVVTVSVTLDLDTPVTPISGGDLLSPDSLLTCLYPGQTGTDTPNQSNNFALQRLGMGEFSSYLKEVGRPYLWVQWLCGLNFLDVSCSTATASAAFSASHMQTTIKRLRRRLRARLSLQKQLLSIERCCVPVSVEYQGLFPTKISAALNQWRRTTLADFTALDYTEGILQGLAKDTDMFFTGIIEHRSAKMMVHAVVSSDYPNTPPLLVVCINWKMQRHSLNDENIRDMQAEVNVHYDELVNSKSRDQLLTNQLQRLMMCFDVYLETEANTNVPEGPTEFAREKVFPRLTKGPQRGRPYKYNPQLGFFSHR
ncbi:THO complex subunit 5-like protein [Lamellibrachia satsuma]|nr:THO complex subunit 5-like protein [Lamellibrachia satsuma]